jgi:hypothetical protein
MMKDALVVEIKNVRIVETRIFTTSHATFLSGVGDRARCRALSCCVHHLTLSASQLRRILWVEKIYLKFPCGG